MPHDIQMPKYNLVDVEVPRREGLIRGAQIVRVLSQWVLGAFHGHTGDWVTVETQLRARLEELYPTALCMAVYQPGRREEMYLFGQLTLLLMKPHDLYFAVPHFFRQKSFVEGAWLGLAILCFLVNWLEDLNYDTDDKNPGYRCIALPVGNVLQPPPRPNHSWLYPTACALELCIGPIVCGSLPCR